MPSLQIAREWCIIKLDNAHFILNPMKTGREKKVNMLTYIVYDFFPN